MKFFAILYPGETLSDCWRVCREVESGFERYRSASDSWELDPELFLIYAGEPEVEEITEAQANDIIAKLKRNRESVSNSKNRT